MWYSRENWPFRRDHEVLQEYENWLRLVPWQFFATFTFAWPVSDAQALKIFDKFIDDIERCLRHPVCYVRGDEKRFSGLGKPASPRHFHVLIASTAVMHPDVLEAHWMTLAGSGPNGAGAKVDWFDGRKSGIGYVLKFINQPDGDWACRNLDLFIPNLCTEVGTRSSRRVKRHRRRLEKAQR